MADTATPAAVSAVVNRSRLLHPRDVGLVERPIVVIA